MPETDIRKACFFRLESRPVIFTNRIQLTFLSEAPYYIVITRKNQALLSFLRIRVIVNGQAIYPLLTTEPVVIPVEKDYPKIVLTDGFHITRPIELEFRQPAYFDFHVVCAIDDLQLAGAALFLILFYLLGFFTSLFLLKLLSFTPLLWLLFRYYITRRDFIRIVRAR